MAKRTQVVEAVTPSRQLTVIDSDEEVANQRMAIEIGQAGPGHLRQELVGRLSRIDHPGDLAEPCPQIAANRSPRRRRVSSRMRSRASAIQRDTLLRCT